MKKKFKAFISCLLAVLMLVPTTVAFAATPTSENEQLAKNIVAIEDELAANDTDVVTELSDMIAEYKAMLNNPDENIDVDNVQSLISTLEEMLDEYQMYKAGVSTYKFHVIYSPAVAAVVAYFKVQGYSLAAELLATVYKGNIIKNLIMDCQSYTKYRPNETTGGIFVTWRRKEELPTGA